MQALGNTSIHTRCALWNGPKRRFTSYPIRIWNSGLQSLQDRNNRDAR